MGIDRCIMMIRNEGYAQCSVSYGVSPGMYQTPTRCRSRTLFWDASRETRLSLCKRGVGKMEPQT